MLLIFFSNYKFKIGSKINFNDKTYFISNKECIPCYLDNKIVYIPYYILSKENEESLYVNEDSIIKENL